VVPSYSSVTFVLVVPGGTLPPKAKPAVCVPAPPNIYLAVVKVPPLVQVLPLYSSDVFVSDPGST
jgi:hypothetical protein